VVLEHCGISANDFDKKIIITNAVDIHRFGGMAYDMGWVVVHSYESSRFLAHELGHTFGATDLYINMGGQFQYARALMSNYPVKEIEPSPALSMVMRGELGLLDSDFNGVIDIAEFAVFPESIEVKLRASLLVDRMTIEVSDDVYALENENKKRVLIKGVDIDIPLLGIKGLVNGVRAFNLTKDQVDTLKNLRSVNMNVKAEYSFTDKDFTRKTLIFNKLMIVPLNPTGSTL